MSSAAIERYRQHEVWEVLRLKIEALNSARYSTEALEQARSDMLEVLDVATRSKDNPLPTIYDSTLNRLRDVLNGLIAEEGQFETFVQNGQPTAAAVIVRDLPGPPPRQVNQRYIDALDTAIAARETTLKALEARVDQLTNELASGEALLMKLTGDIADQTSKITTDAATITQVTSGAAEQLAAEWTNRLDAWELERKNRDAELDKQLVTNIELLAGSAVVGQRLVEHAAGLLTATEWAGRAKRERLNAIWLRWGSIAAFLGALGVGGYILWHAIDNGFELTVGDGILRGALVLALVGIGTFLSTEGRRHFKEADSAEEVSLALTAIEPFYAGASTEAREAARTAVGDSVFVKNVLSRFANRDASKHANTTNQELSEVADLLTKGATAAKIIDGKT